MRIESSVTSLSWIPSEAIQGLMKVPFAAGLAHWDEPPPEVLEDLEELRRTDRFRFANELRAWIDVEDGRVVDHGYSGGGHIGSTTIRVGSKSMTFQAVQFPTIQADPLVYPNSVRFMQTAGGRTGVPMPRPVPHPPFFRLTAPTAWSTLSLTIHADGSVAHAVAGASSFPRHWVYDAERKLVAKTGIIDFKDWSKHAFGERTPWGEEDSPAVVTKVESALERTLSAEIMRPDRKPKKIKVKEGKLLVEQGQPGNEIFLLLDGLLAVEVDGTVVAEVGPGAVIGERAILEGGTRTATLRALTNCRLAVAAGEDIDRDALNRLALGHRLEER